MDNLDGVVAEDCTLPSLEQPLRVAEFDRLFAAHLVGLRWVGTTRVRLELAVRSSPDGQAEALDQLRATVRDLTDRETSCCSFFTFTLEAARGLGAAAADDGAGLVLDVEVPPGREPVLVALASRAEAVRAGRTASGGLHGADA